MAACSGCGEDISSSASFCASCGAAQGDELHILGVTDPHLLSQSEEVVVRKSGRWGWATLAVLLPFLALTAWSLSRPGADDEAAETKVEEVAEDEDDKADDSEEEIARSTTTTQRRTTTTEAPLSAGFESPYRGSESGLLVFASAPGGLAQIDLDTGQIILWDKVRRSPVLVTGGHMVFRHRNSDQTTAAPLDDLEAVVSLPIQPWGVVASDREGFVWGVSREMNFPNDVNMSEVEVATGEVRQTVKVEVTSTFYYGPQMAPGLMSPRSGGIYEQDGDTYEWVAPGALMAHGGGLALVQQCDIRLSCRYEWLDTTTYGPVDRPIPEDAQFFGGLSVNGQWLTMIPLGAEWSMSLFNTQTGEVIANVGSNNGPGSIAISPDETIAAVFGRTNQLELIDLATGDRSTVADVRGMEYENGVVFVPKSAISG